MKTAREKSTASRDAYLSYLIVTRPREIQTITIFSTVSCIFSRVCVCGIKILHVIHVFRVCVCECVCDRAHYLLLTANIARTTAARLNAFSSTVVGSVYLLALVLYCPLLGDGFSSGAPHLYRRTRPAAAPKPTDQDPRPRRADDGYRTERGTESCTTTTTTTTVVEEALAPETTDARPRVL